MRIVGGLYRGRRLRAPAGAATRPTSERVREALFDILGERVREGPFLDLYAGTGAVGLEALSRGAPRAVLVESATTALKVLRANVALMDLPPESARVVALPAAAALARLGAEGFAAAVTFCDPPYADAGWTALLARMGAALPWEKDAVLVVEHAARTPPEPPPGFVRGRSYRYGDTGLTVFERE